jgi:hypothetical protein
MNLFQQTIISLRTANYATTIKATTLFEGRRRMRISRNLSIGIRWFPLGAPIYHSRITHAPRQPHCPALPFAILQLCLRNSSFGAKVISFRLTEIVYKGPLSLIWAAPGLWSRRPQAILLYHIKTVSPMNFTRNILCSQRQTINRLQLRARIIFRPGLEGDLRRSLPPDADKGRLCEQISLIVGQSTANSLDSSYNGHPSFSRPPAGSFANSVHAVRSLRLSSCSTALFAFRGGLSMVPNTSAISSAWPAPGALLPSNFPE